MTEEEIKNNPELLSIIREIGVSFPETKSVRVIIIPPEKPKVSELRAQLPISVRNSVYDKYIPKEIIVLDYKDGSLVDIVESNIKGLYPISEPKYLIYPDNLDGDNLKAFKKMFQHLNDKGISFKTKNIKLDEERTF